VELCEKKQQRCADHDLGEAGDGWDHTAVAADSKLVVSLMVGKRTYAQTLAVVQDAHARLRAGHLPAICTDAFASDESALLEVFGHRYPAKGRGRRPVMRWRQGLAYGQVKKSYKGGRVDGVEVRAVHGKARLEHVLSLLGYKQINTSVVERHNGTSRLRNQRKVRKTLAFSKARRYPRWMSWLSVGLYNFCRPHSSVIITQADQVIHRSPAMAAGVTNHLWSTHEWLLRPVLGGQR
jgi:IS1 family transposase